MRNTEDLVLIVSVIAICACLACMLDGILHKPKPPGGGCIIIGYQGIGKSSLARKSLKYIDLESSSFKISVNGSTQRDTNWYIAYCKIAHHLADQGYVVFTSSHVQVQNYIEDLYQDKQVDAYICFPSKRLQVEWIDKLKRRWEETESEKDFAAWRNAVECYSVNIDRLHSSKIPSIIIKRMNYDLEKFISEAITSNKAIK